MHRIDVHHHHSPPEFARTIDRLKTGQQPLVDWTPAQSIDDMDRAGIATAITSLGHPGVWFGDDSAARCLARTCNEFSARLMADHPGRFGMFATLPMPDIEGSLREIEFAFDTLHADGVNLITSYAGKWLGDPAFTPVMEELNRRKAVIHVHPTIPAACKNLIPHVADHLIEFSTDTSRAIASLLLSGTATRCPDISFIFSHAGGTIPYIVERLTWWLSVRKDMAACVPNGVLEELKRFFYDIAFSANPHAFASLLTLVSPSQILFGSDFPFRTGQEHAAGLLTCGLGSDDIQAIERENALRLLPRLARLR
jgi:predicted TIM-barrel fold metal-dependent hydrolase